MKNFKIRGLDEKCASIISAFMISKMEDKSYTVLFETDGSGCNMDWVEDGMDISGEDMLHELFEWYGECEEDGMSDEDGDWYTYTLKIDDTVCETGRRGENWNNAYWLVKKIN